MRTYEIMMDENVWFCLFIGSSPTQLEKLVYDTDSRIQTSGFHLKGSCACLLWSKCLQTDCYWDPLLSSKSRCSSRWFIFPQAGRCTV